ncbi:hypothetical protein LshimejAT787_0304990 [Lyophyllum shimeji]|uniref:Uncharacterized protein n=1 Tax=Lyophyllum shimeji TaxID=47721 RepID=A0A9P3PIV2_LYOSH|nr:hypothetical protein LshimejAT787_0304990 [Lyophyllum shimeji]
MGIFLRLRLRSQAGSLSEYPRKTRRRRIAEPKAARATEREHEEAARGTVKSLAMVWKTRQHHMRARKGEAATEGEENPWGHHC